MFPTIVDMKEPIRQAIVQIAGQKIYDLLQGDTLKDIQNTPDDNDVFWPPGLITFFPSKKPEDNLKKLSLESFPVTNSDLPLVKLAVIKEAYRRKTKEAVEELGLLELLNTEAFPITSPLLEYQPYKIIDVSNALQKIALRAGADLDDPSDSVTGFYRWEENGVKHGAKFHFFNHPWSTLVDGVFDMLISHLRNLNVLRREEDSFSCCRVIRQQYGPIPTPKNMLHIIMPLTKVRCNVRLGNHGLETKSVQWTICSMILLKEGWIWSDTSIVYFSATIPILSLSI
ncbi:hypothetical protein B0J13DRAFT_333173 [Dactylonectria estremocensis]|nr:hypothetical protein B0J13DRAFT_333173 [Dactylonectria estremocensis]